MFTSSGLVGIFPHTHLPHLRNATYFSFFSDLHDSDHVVGTVVETLAILTVFVVSVAANVGAAALVTWERRLLANKTILTLNLFVADLLFVSMIPLIVAVRWSVSWSLGRRACRAMLYVMCMSGCVTITTLASISVERLQAILRMQTTPMLNLRAVCATLAFIWVFSMLTCIPISLFFTVVEVETPQMEDFHICTVKWPDRSGEVAWSVAVTAFCFLLPGLIIVVSYTKILQITKTCRRKVLPGGTGGDRPRYHVSRQDIKLFRTLLILVLSFLVMWSPVFIVALFMVARSLLHHQFLSSTVFFWVVTFTLANSALNPILYALCQLRSVWRRFCCGPEAVKRPQMP